MESEVNLSEELQVLRGQLNYIISVLTKYSSGNKRDRNQLENKKLVVENEIDIIDQRLKLSNSPSYDNIAKLERLYKL